MPLYSEYKYLDYIYCRINEVLAMERDNSRHLNHERSENPWRDRIEIGCSKGASCCFNPLRQGLVNRPSSSLHYPPRISRVANCGHHFGGKPNSSASRGGNFLVDYISKTVSVNLSFDHIEISKISQRYVHFSYLKSSL